MIENAIEHNIAKLASRIRLAAEKNLRAKSSISTLAVSKTRSAVEIRASFKELPPQVVYTVLPGLTHLVNRAQVELLVAGKCSRQLELEYFSRRADLPVGGNAVVETADAFVLQPGQVCLGQFEAGTVLAKCRKRINVKGLDRFLSQPLEICLESGFEKVKWV